MVAEGLLIVFHVYTKMHMIISPGDPEKIYFPVFI